MKHVLTVFLTASLFLLVASSLTTAQISRDSAITLVTDQVIATSPYASTLVAFLYDPPGADTLLAAGTDVAPRDSAFVTTLAGPKWFFWLDLTGEMKYAHPCSFVFVDPLTGSVDVSDGEWWPAITPPGDTTVYPWSSMEDRYHDGSGSFYGSYGGTPIPPELAPRIVPRPGRDGNGIMVMRFGNASLLSGNTCAILVGGGATRKGEENAWQNDLDSIAAMMGTPAPGGGTGMASEVQQKNNATKADIQKMIDSAAAHGCNSIIFYYTGHGSKGNGGSMYLKDVDLKYSTLATMLNIAGLKFKDVMLDDCYSGSALDDFGGKTTTVKIITASDSTHTSGMVISYIDSNGNSMLDNGDSIVGGKSGYTAAMMKCWRKLRDSLNRNPTLKEIHDWVRHVNPDSINEKQNPSSSTIYPVITFEQTINVPGVYQFLGTGITIDFQNIGAPFDLTVTRTLGPAPGQIDPVDVEIVQLSLVSYWHIEQNPPTPFQANVLFGFAGSGSPGNSIPMEDFSLAFRPNPGFSNPNPFWTRFPNLDYVPLPPAIVALGVNEFSEWAYALLASDTTVDVPHAPKWNMLSVPLLAADMHKDTLFPDAGSNAFAYNAGYTIEDILEVGRGYWMKFDSAGSTALTGTAIHRDTFDVVSGWNMVGSITDPVPVGSVSTIPPGMTLSNFFAYNAGYSAAGSIEPGAGYWVKTSSDGSIILDGGALFAKNVPPPDYPGLNRLDIADAAGNRQSLYFGSPGALKAGVTAEMPPPPPQGVFDARFGEGNFIEFYGGIEGKEYTVRVTSAAYPLTLSWEIADGESRALAINGGVPMKGKGSIVMKEAGPVKITAGASAVPAKYSLSQNYPNPFNPLTKIVYDLPADVKVRLTVFDILGREVTVLVDEEQTAGVKTAEFDGGPFPSGVYFYRLTAGSFSATKKLMLVK